MLESVIEMGLMITKPGDLIETIRTALYLVYKIALVATIEIKDTHAELLRICHNRKAYLQSIAKDELLALASDACSDDVTEPERLGCIEIVEGYVHLKERVILSQN